MVFFLIPDFTYKLTQVIIRLMKEEKELICFRVLTEKQVIEALSSVEEGSCTLKFESFSCGQGDVNGFVGRMKVEVRGNFMLERDVETS